jgi:hypothetical protein
MDPRRHRIILVLLDKLMRRIPIAGQSQFNGPAQVIIHIRHNRFLQPNRDRCNPAFQFLAKIVIVTANPRWNLESMTATGRSIFKGITITFLLLVIFFLFAASFLSLENTRNIPLNDSDLIFDRPNIPVESNAFYTLLKATNQAYWPGKLDKRLGDLSQNTNWDNSITAEVLEKNRACLGSFDEAMQQPFLLVPQVKGPDDDISYVAGWKELALLKSIQINSLHRDKNDKEALDEAFAVINFGHRAENAGGPVIHFMVGSAIKAIGLLRIRQMTVDTSLSEADLAQAIDRLKSLGPNQEGLTNALKVEYEMQRNMIDDFARGKLPDTTNTDFERAMTSVGMKPFLNAKKTKMEVVESDRFLFSNFSKPYSDISWSNQPNMDIETNDSIAARLASGNAVGGILYKMTEPALDGLARAKSKEDVSVTATQLLLALKIYKMRHGKLPDSLAELVPDFFPTVPLDDFDGKPFRYLPEKKIIYSVGPCLKDLSGKERDHSDYSKDYNLPFKIEF